MADELQAELNQLKTGQAIIEKEIKSLTRMMEQIGEVLIKQVEHDQKMSSIDEKITVLFSKIENIESNGTKLCTTHNAQFKQYETDCKNKTS